MEDNEEVFFFLPVPSHGVPPSRRVLSTVGHSNLDFTEFLKLLIDGAVELLVDVRSRPQSARFPQFSQQVLEKSLENESITYLFLGEELGGRPAG